MINQAKRRDKKVFITDIAIEKVPYIKYKGFSEEQNHIMQELARDVLVISKESNDSNEVAITCDLGSEDPLSIFGVSFGEEHEVDIMVDTLSNHLIVSEESIAVVILHNHPSTQTFSLQDIHFFITHTTIEVMVVVSNQGKVHYIMREQDYEYGKARDLFYECIEGIHKNSEPEDYYFSALSFLAKSSECGIYYR